MKKAAIFLCMIISLFLLTHASASSISGDIYIYEDGFARFDIETTTPIELEGLSFNNNKITGKTSSLTSKRGESWTFSLNVGEYENIFIDIHLPSNLDSITSISGVDNIIDIDKKTITLVDSGALDFIISYKLKEVTDYSWLIWIFIILVILIVIFFYKKSRKKKEHLQHIMPLINENEQKIIDLLMKKSMRQKELRKTLNIPKASFSRYLFNLEKKKLIIREGEGKNKVVKLK